MSADKKKILLIYPPSPVMNREDRCQQPVENLIVIPPLPPTDLMYLASIAEQCGLEAKIRDYSLGGDLLKDLKDATKGTNIKIGAQNMHFEEKGAFTGEISPLMLKELDIDDNKLYFFK